MMSVLKQLSASGLSTYHILKLQSKGIFTARQFLAAEFDHLIEITGLPEDPIIQAKNKLFNAHGPRQQTLRELVQKEVNSDYLTGIESLDQLLADDPFRAGSFWEICGAPGIGKTQFCHTVAVNFATKFESDKILYIDTKYDFCGTRIMQMLRARGVEKSQCGDIMQRLLVERTLSLEGVLDILDKLLIALAKNNNDVMGIKVLIIDALPAVWFLYLSDEKSMKGKQMLCMLGHTLYKLAVEHNMGIIVVNLLLDNYEFNRKTVITPSINSNGNSSDSGDDEGSNVIVQDEKRPACGEYWRRVPQLRLTMEKSSDIWLCNKRILRVINSSYTPEDLKCSVTIEDTGIM